MGNAPPASASGTQKKQAREAVKKDGDEDGKQVSDEDREFIASHDVAAFKQDSKQKLESSAQEFEPSTLGKTLPDLEDIKLDMVDNAPPASASGTQKKQAREAVKKDGAGFLCCLFYKKAL